MEPQLSRPSGQGLEQLWVGGHGCLPHCHLGFLTAWQSQGREASSLGQTANIPGGKVQMRGF